MSGFLLIGSRSISDHEPVELLKLIPAPTVTILLMSAGTTTGGVSVGGVSAGGVSVAGVSVVVCWAAGFFEQERIHKGNNDKIKIKIIFKNLFITLASFAN
jgi:hypothetical protein